MSHCTICHPARRILYHVTELCTSSGVARENLEYFSRERNLHNYDCTRCHETDDYLWQPGELHINLSTSTYLCPFQEERKLVRESHRIIRAAGESLLNKPTALEIECAYTISTLQNDIAKFWATTNLEVQFRATSLGFLTNPEFQN